MYVVFSLRCVAGMTQHNETCLNIEETVNKIGQSNVNKLTNSSF